MPLGVFQADSAGHLKLMVSDIGPAGFYIAADAAQYVPASCHGIGPIGTTIDPSAPAGEFTLYGSAYPGSDHGWYTSPGHGLYGNERWTNSNGATENSSADWTVQLNAGQCYDVSAYIPDTYANALASYRVFDANGPHDATVDQSVWTNQFVSLGTYHADANGSLSVSVSDTGQTGHYVAADAMQFLPSQDCGAGGPTGSPGYPQSTYGPGSAQFTTYNWWATQSGHGLIGQEMWTHTNGPAVDSRALWVPSLVPGGCYTISAYIPDNYADNTQAHYYIWASSITPREVTVDQSQVTGWTELGTFTTYPDGSILVEVTDQGPDTTTFTAADAMRFTPC